MAPRRKAIDPLASTPRLTKNTRLKKSVVPKVVGNATLVETLRKTVETPALS